jgi:hypothetical protein
VAKAPWERIAPGRLALLLVVAAGVLAAVGLLAPRIREFALVAALFLVFLAGGVLNWDRRGGH